MQKKERLTESTFQPIVLAVASLETAFNAALNSTAPEMLEKSAVAVKFVAAKDVPLTNNATAKTKNFFIVTTSIKNYNFVLTLFRDTILF